MSDEKIKIDRHLPFVNAVFGLIAGEVPEDAAIDILCKAEEKHGVMILGQPYSSRASDMFVPRPEQPPCSIEETLRLLGDSQSIEAYENFLQVFCINDSTEEELNERRLYPFLSELCLVLSGGDFEDYCVVSQDPAIIGYTWRWWGGIMADWANASRVLTPRPQSHFGMWDYIHFYADYYIASYIEDYADWAKAVQRVLDERTARLRQSMT